MDAFADWLTPFLTHGSLLALPLVALGGIITAFNPCCLPMYPAALGFMGHSSCKTCNTGIRTGQTQTAIIFVLGMATATAGMGILTAALGWVFGQFGTPFRLAMAAIPMLMGLNLLGVIPLRLPRWHIQPSGNRMDHIHAYAAGLLFSLAIAPCATPILLGILTLVALQGDMVYGGLLMFIYGLGSGLPLVLAGHGLGRIQHLFESPRRQLALRRISGALLLGVALYII